MKSFCIIINRSSVTLRVYNVHVRDVCASEQKKKSFLLHNMSITFKPRVLDSCPKYEKTAEMMTFQKSFDSSAAYPKLQGSHRHLYSINCHCKSVLFKLAIYILKCACFYMSVWET